MAAKITAAKYGGDDAYSWAVFVDGRPAFTGLSRPEVAHYKRLAAEIAAERAAKS
jgi:hypothetical protein